MNSIESFIEYFRNTLDEKNRNLLKEKKISKDFFDDFIKYTPKTISELNQYILDDRISLFYSKLNDLKYLCIFDEELNKYWFAMRGLSGAIAKLLVKKDLENARKVHQYYIHKYGDRIALRDENWFENKRWQFLDSLEILNSDDQLSHFINQNKIVLKCYLDNYHFHVNCFIGDIRKSLSFL